jgi:hypothetical protein
MQGEERVSSWLTVTPAQAAGVILGFAVLALAMPREDSFLIPERRDWRGMLRRRFSRRERERLEVTGELEAAAYVAELHEDRGRHRAVPVMTIRRDELPSMHRTWVPTTLLTDAPAPWEEAPLPEPGPEPEPVLPPPPARRRRRQGDPPTIVMDVVRPAIDRDLGMYLSRLPRYPED